MTAQHGRAAEVRGAAEGDSGMWGGGDFKALRSPFKFSGATCPFINS